LKANAGRNRLAAMWASDVVIQSVRSPDRHS
jgi:hypothetical protein